MANKRIKKKKAKQAECEAEEFIKAWQCLNERLPEIISSINDAVTKVFEAAAKIALVLNEAQKEDNNTAAKQEESSR